MSTHNLHTAHDQVSRDGEQSNADPMDCTPRGENPDATYYDSNHPYSFSYGDPENVASFDRPLIFSGPFPDTDANNEPETDRDSTLGDHVSTGSVLVADSGYQWRHEHGRRYHGRLEGQRSDYHLPNDELELDRLDLQHQVFLKTLGGALHRAPIGGHPQRVLDLGTGTGIWAVDFAHTCPSAEVIGTDLSPVQPTNVPPNCRFYVEDCDTDWSFDGPFDFIHGRMLVVAITNWTRLVKQAFANLRPGGWIELQDLSFPFRCDDGTAAPDSAVLHWSSCLLKAAGELGIDLTASTRFPTMLNAAGFVDVHVETHAWPINSWPRDRALKEIGMYVCEDLHQGLEGFSLSMFSRGLKWEDEQIKQVLSDAARDIRNTSAHIYLPISICWARKPGPADS